MAYPNLGGVDARELDRWKLTGAPRAQRDILSRFRASYDGAPAALEATPPTQPVAAPAQAPAYGTGYYTPPPQAAGTPPLVPGDYGGGASEQVYTTPNGLKWRFQNGNWVLVPGPGQVGATVLRGGYPTPEEAMFLERAREDWQAEQLRGVRASPETQARAGQLQEQGRRELYGRAFTEADKYGEQMGARGFGESPMAGMVQGDIMQNAAEAKADADLAALNQAIAEGQNLIFGGEALRKPGIAALLNDALDARSLERRAALERELGPDDFMQLLGSLGGMAFDEFNPVRALRRAGGGRGRDDDWEWDPNRVPVEF